MSIPPATNISLVWLVNSEEPSPAVESRPLIRANAAAWGHKSRRHENRNHSRAKVSSATEVHFSVCGHERCQLWPTNLKLILSDHGTILQHYRGEGSSSWTREVFRCDTKGFVFQRKETTFFCTTYT